MTLLPLIFDGVLGFTLLWLAWQLLGSPALFRAIVLFIAFGLLMALIWVRLDAPDVALAEAAIGAGLTGALLLAALARVEPPGGETANLHPEKDGQGDIVSVTEGGGLPFRRWLVALHLVLACGLGYAVLSLPSAAPGLSEAVANNLALSGVSNPVTAVLLNFRAYDTLLEMGVLLLALLAVWSLGRAPDAPAPAAGGVLALLARLLTPLLLLVAGYLLWVGSRAPGGAFQAGSVLGAAGVLLVLAGWRLGRRFAQLPLRITLVVGLALFMAVGLSVMLAGGSFLAYPPASAGGLILLIEAAATLSIGMILAALFLGSRPGSRGDQ